MPMEEKHGEQEEYQFIQENIVPGKRKKLKRFLSMVFAALILGAVFGLAAGMVLYMTQPWLQTLVSKEEPKEEQGDSVEWSGENEGDDPDNLSGTGDGEGEITGSDSTGDDSTGQDVSMTESEDTPSDMPEGETNQTDAGNENPGDAENPPVEPVIIEQKIEANLEDFRRMFQEISALAADANQFVVKVASVTNGVDWFQNPYETETETSGLILASDDQLIYILVNFSNIDQASQIRITFKNGISATASFWDADTTIGLAIVTVDKTQLPVRFAREIVVAPLGESYSVQLGEPVLALGNPNGYMYSVLIGLITNRESSAYVADNKLDLFHTDMALAEQGEGIIVNLDGKVIGVITHKYEENPGMCTVLSISQMRPLLEKLLSRTSRTYLGVVGTDLPDKLAEKLVVAGGVYVSSVENGSPAEQAGIRSGDVILQAGDVSVFTMAALSTYLQEQEPGTETTLRVCRMVREEARTTEYTVTLGQKDAQNR